VLIRVNPWSCSASDRSNRCEAVLGFCLVQYPLERRGFLAVLAVQAIRRMRGGAQSQLMLGADGNLWVVKFQNNPQHLRVLANELIATRLAQAVGLTVPATDVVEVSAWLIANSPGMHVELVRGRGELYTAGLQFGSRFIGGLMPGQVVDYLPEPQLDDVRNLAEFAGMLALDKWTSTRASASTPANGRFRTARCAVCTHATACMRASPAGRASSRGSAASSRWRETPSGTSRTWCRPSGMAATWRRSSGCWNSCCVGAAACVS
jgi:hypothetical protein